MITNDVLLHEDNKAPALTCNIVLAKESQMPRPLSVISRYAAVCGILAMFSTAASADTWKIQLAVINTAGEVYARDLTADETVYPPHLTATTVGPPQKLDGPSLFGGPDDAFVLGSTNKISVVTTSGVLWTHRIDWYFDTESIDDGYPAAGTLFGGPDAKYVLADETSGLIYVVTTEGKVWAHPWGTNMSDGYPLTGPSLFGAPNDKYVLLDGSRILVVNTGGQVYAHDLWCTHPIPHSFLCPPDTVGGGYPVNGPSLFPAGTDKYVVLADGHILVINTSGRVYARTISHDTVGGPYELKGPSLFGGPNDKYVVVYDVDNRGTRIK